MVGVLQILVSTAGKRRPVLTVAAATLLLAACGQKGPLVLPSGPAAVGRATLPQTLAPSTAVVPATSASAIPPTGVATPAPRP